MSQWMKFGVFGYLLLVVACSDSDPEPVPPPSVNPPIGNIQCRVDEIEFRNDDDVITGIREFNYDITKQDRLESVSIIEDLDGEPLNLRFEFRYRDETSVVPSGMNEIFGGDIVTSIDFKYDENDNLTEFTQQQVQSPNIPPQSYVFTYEESPLADDSVNTRIIIFDIENLTRDWIDVFPAIFTSGGQRIVRYDRVSFRGDIIEFCLFTYDDEGLLSEIVCRSSDFLLTEVWNFSYDRGLLVSAFWQLPNFRAMSDYTYNSKQMPVSMTSTTNGNLNWKGAYFYLCR
jgi:hypothetical protein